MTKSTALLNSTDNKQSLTDKYEGLRSLALEARGSSANGCSIIILRGMTSWINACLALEPINAPSVNLGSSNRDDEALPRILPQIQKELTMILANMLLTQSTNERINYYV